MGTFKKLPIFHKMIANCIIRSKTMVVVGGSSGDVSEEPENEL